MIDECYVQIHGEWFKVHLKDTSISVGVDEIPEISLTGYKHTVAVKENKLDNLPFICYNMFIN